jgi:hypothetical protein
MIVTAPALQGESGAPIDNVARTDRKLAPPEDGRAPIIIGGGTARTAVGRPSKPEILLVEDDPALRAVLAMALVDAGYVPLAAATPDEAIALTATSGRVAPVVIDVHLRAASSRS